MQNIEDIETYLNNNILNTWIYYCVTLVVNMDSMTFSDLYPSFSY